MAENALEWTRAALQIRELATEVLLSVLPAALLRAEMGLSVLPEALLFGGMRLVVLQAPFPHAEMGSAVMKEAFLRRKVASGEAARRLRKGRTGFTDGTAVKTDSSMAVIEPMRL